MGHDARSHLRSQQSAEEELVRLKLEAAAALSTGLHASAAHDVRHEQDRLQQLELEIYSFRGAAEQAAEQAKVDQEMQQHVLQFNCEQQVSQTQQAARLKEQQLQQQLMEQLEESSNFKSKVARDESRKRELERELEFTRQELEHQLSLAEANAALSFDALTQVAMSQVAEDAELHFEHVRLQRAAAEQTRLEFEEANRHVLFMEQDATQDEPRSEEITEAEAIKAAESRLRAMEEEWQRRLAQKEAHQAASRREEEKFLAHSERGKQLMAQISQISHFKSKEDESLQELERQELDLHTRLQEDAAHSIEAAMAQQIAMAEAAEEEEQAAPLRAWQRRQFEEAERHVLSMEQKAARDEQRIKEILDSEEAERKLEAMKAEWQRKIAQHPLERQSATVC